MLPTSLLGGTGIPGQLAEALARLTFVRISVEDAFGRAVHGAAVSMRDPNTQAPLSSGFAANPMPFANTFEYVFLGTIDEVLITVSQSGKSNRFHPTTFILRWQGTGTTFSARVDSASDVRVPRVQRCDVASWFAPMLEQLRLGLPPLPFVEPVEADSRMIEVTVPLARLVARISSTTQRDVVEHELSVSTVDPHSVDAGGTLRFSGPAAGVRVDGRVLQGPQGSVPRWFCVAVPPGLRDFSRIALFFHPTPGQAGYDDAQYQNFDKWRGIYHYVPEMGGQLTQSGKQLVFIMPLLPGGSTETLGSFAAEWLELCSELLGEVRANYTDESGPVEIRDVVVSSFSSGVKYLHTFLRRGARVKEVVREIYDIDGRFSTFGQSAEQVRVTAPPLVRTYDQRSVTAAQAEKAARLTNEYHVALPRWSTHAPRIPNNGQLHGWMPKYMFFHALSKCGVG